MTREEAIAILEVSKHMATSGRLYTQAIDMAIEALSAEAEEYDDYEHATLVDIKEPLKVAVVQCKDCDRGFGSPVCPIQRQGWAINTDTFYCEWGERREP